MPGIKDIDRVKKMLATSAKLQFWEVQMGQEVLPYFSELNQLVKAKGDSIGVAKTTNFTNLIQLNSTPGNAVANVKLSDTAVVNKILTVQLLQKLVR
jgi:SecD/SecF fusion protein